MGWFSCSNNNNDNNDRRKREIEYELRDCRSEYDSLEREISHASDMWFSCRGYKDKEKELEHWNSLENKLIDKQYYYGQKIKDLEYELSTL